MHSSHRLGNPLPQRLVILRALQLGDLLCSVPAFRALRAALPTAEITLVGLPWAREFVDRFHVYLDRFLEFPGYPGLPERTGAYQHLPTFLRQVQQANFDLAIQLQGNGVITNPLTVLLGAKQQAGYFLPGNYCPDGDRFLPYPDHEPEIWRSLRLLEFLGVPLAGTALEFPLRQDDWAAFSTLLATQPLRQQNYVCLHPGARSPLRRWAPQQFAEVADALASWGWQVVLTGTAAERELTQAVAQAMQAPSLNLAGCTNLGALAVLLQQAQLLVCNDTGVSHLAVALGVPSVVIFTGSDPQRWAPLVRDRHRIVEPLAGATPATVITAAQTLLTKVTADVA